MRIAIDMHAVGSRLTANERYIQSVAEQLLELDRKNEYFLFSLIPASDSRQPI